MTRDRTSYGGAIADSWEEQTPPYIVKRRCFDTPTFLDDSSDIGCDPLQSEFSFARGASFRAYARVLDHARPLLPLGHDQRAKLAR